VDAGDCRAQFIEGVDPPRCQSGPVTPSCKVSSNLEQSRASVCFTCKEYQQLVGACFVLHSGPTLPRVCSCTCALSSVYIDVLQCITCAQHPHVEQVLLNHWRIALWALFLVGFLSLITSRARGLAAPVGIGTGIAWSLHWVCSLHASVGFSILHHGLIEIVVSHAARRTYIHVTAVARRSRAPVISQLPWPPDLAPLSGRAKSGYTSV
jgi:hypothetical protein